MWSSFSFCLGILEIKLVCQSRLSLSFLAKLTSGRRLGRAGPQLRQPGCLFGVTILRKCCGQTAEKIITRKRSARLQASAFFFSPCSKQIANEANWQIWMKWMKQTERWIWWMAGTSMWPEVKGGILTAANVDTVASSVGRMEDVNSHAMRPRTHTPKYTVTHTHRC